MFLLERMQHDYDERYDTRVSRPYGNSKIGFIFGSLFLLIGAVAIVVTIIDLFRGVYNQNTRQPLNDFVYTWDENPIWPSYGKGFWIGLIVFNIFTLFNF